MKSSHDMTRYEWEDACRFIRAARSVDEVERAQKAFLKEHGFYPNNLRHEVHVARALVAGIDVSANVLRSYPKSYWPSTLDLAHIARLDHYQELMKKHELDLTPRYLILKGTCINENFDGPEIAVIALNDLDHAEKCSETISRVLTENPALASLDLMETSFNCLGPRWLKFSEELEECDFYEELQRNRAVVAQNLPSFLQDGESEIATDSTRLWIFTSNPREVRWRAYPKNTNFAMSTEPVVLDEIQTLAIFKGEHIRWDQGIDSEDDYVNVHMSR